MVCSFFLSLVIPCFLSHLTLFTYFNYITLPSSLPVTLPCVSQVLVKQLTRLVHYHHNSAPPHFPATDPRARIADTYGVEETLWAIAQTTSTDEAGVLLESSLDNIRGTFLLIVPQIPVLSSSHFFFSFF